MHRTSKQLLAAALIAAYTAFVPVVRSGMHLEVGYNEGWNLYNARAVLAHQPLYAEKFGWHTVNYPALSFYISAWLSHLTGDLLYTGRMLSLLGLLGSALLLAAMVHRMTGSRHAAIFTALLTVSVMCASAPGYIGQYDPQIFATPFFLAALYLYLRSRDRTIAMVFVALLFILAGNIKHNLIDIPLAVALDLLLARRGRSLAFFLGTAIPAAALSLWMNQHFAGPAFFSNLLAGRGYSLRHAFDNTIGTLGPLIPPFAIACLAAWRLRDNPALRIATLWLACAVVLNIFFAGGAGVASNALFDTLLATVLLLGIFIHRIRFVTGPQQHLPVALALWPLLPLFITNETSFPGRDLQHLRQRQLSHRQALTFLQQTPGPAICESLLLCAEAGKPYLYDPFNATRFIQLGKLDPAPLYLQLTQRHFSVIQLNNSIALTRADVDANRFTPEMLELIRANYRPALTRDGAVLFRPNR